MTRLSFLFISFSSNKKIHILLSLGLTCSAAFPWNTSWNFHWKIWPWFDRKLPDKYSQLGQKKISIFLNMSGIFNLLFLKSSSPIVGKWTEIKNPLWQLRRIQLKCSPHQEFQGNYWEKWGRLLKDAVSLLLVPWANDLQSLPLLRAAEQRSESKT